jgi:hypothetical protein
MQTMTLSFLSLALATTGEGIGEAADRVTIGTGMALMRREGVAAALRRSARAGRLAARGTGASMALTILRRGVGDVGVGVTLPRTRARGASIS